MVLVLMLIRTPGCLFWFVRFWWKLSELPMFLPSCGQEFFQGAPF